MARAGYDGSISVEISVLRQRLPGYDPYAAARQSYEVLSKAFESGGRRALEGKSMREGRKVAKVARFGLVGCGGIGNTHANALALLDEAELVAVCDVDIGRARETAAKHGIAHAFASAEEMLDAVTLDAITVATDHKHHFAPAMAALKRGVNVIIEKPITTSLEEAYTLLETAKARGVKLGGVFQRRFFPAALRMHKAIEDGRIGRVTVAECIALLGRDRAYFARDAWRGTWKGEGGGALMNQAIHMIDMLLWMVGAPTEVYGRWATLKHGDYIDVEDSSCAVVSFDNGALATITVTTTFNRSRRGPASASRCTARLVTLSDCRKPPS